MINNVRPTLDVNYRTLNDASNTLLMGSSFGGIATVYMGWAYDDVFGKLGVFSPAWWAIPNLRDQMRAATARSERVFLYWGTEESSVSANAAAWWPPFLDGYDIYLEQGYTVDGDFLSVVGCGLAHNEAAWSIQMVTALRFLLDINGAPNQLAYTEQLPAVWVDRDPVGELVLSFAALSGFRYQLETSQYLQDPDSWSFVSEQRTNRYWQRLTMALSVDPEMAQQFYRVSIVQD